MAGHGLCRIALATLLALAPAAGWVQTGPTATGEQRAARLLPVVAAHAMVSTQEAKATAIGLDVLKRGGNAVDAAVAVGFALAVTLPRAGNLGGGGFMMVHLAGTGQTIAIDYREAAPAAATRDMFLDDKGEPDPVKSRDTGLSVGVPGTVRGLALALERFGSGKFTLAQLITPAERYAREGYAIEDDLAESIPESAERLGRYPSSRSVFFAGDKPLGRGDTLIQIDLATTLAAIGRDGPQAFYAGPIADKLVAAVKAAGGVMTAGDLADYRPLERAPVRGVYRGHEIVSMPPPSSGGVHVVEILNILEGFDLKASGFGSADTIHLMAESMKPAFADRATWLGDPERFGVPVRGLMSKTYAAARRAAIDPARAASADSVSAGDPIANEADQTTHFSIVDADGNAVANTYTLNFNYGLGLIAEGTGVMLNNEMDDFSAKPGALNAYGLVGGAPNAVGPRARPLSSMSPTFVFKDGRLEMLTGSPGGSRIISTVVQIIVDTVDFGMNIAEAVAAPRMHHQWRPDVLFVEPGLSPDTIKLLQGRGHRVVVGPPSGSANSIQRVAEGWAGASDPRQRGTLAQGY